MNESLAVELPEPPAPPQIDGLAQRVLRRALIKIRHFRHELDSLRSAYAEREDLPGLRTLIDAMSTVVAEGEREVTVRSREVYDSLQKGRNASEETERFCDLVGGLINALEYSLPNVLQTVREPHGREIEALILPFTDLLANLNREDYIIELIFEPDDDYAYDLSVLNELSQIAEKFTSELRDQLADLPQLIAITYPKQLEAETLGHMIIAHEIAHTVLDYQPPGEDGAPVIDAFDDAVTECYQALSEAIANDTGLEGEDLEFEVLESVERMRRWYEELACDALALGMVGPVYVFALADLDLASNRCSQIRGAAGYESHPGLSWRLRSAITQAQTEYLSGSPPGPAGVALAAGLRALDHDLPLEADEISVQEKTLIEIALKMLHESKAVERVLGQARYLPEFLHEEIGLIWEKLVAGIPPAERISRRSNGRRILRAVPEEWSQPFRWQSIFNGAYAYWLEGGPLSKDEEKLRTVPERRRIAQDWIDFNSYVRGSLELANLQAQLVDARGRLDGLNAPRSA